MKSKGFIRNDPSLRRGRRTNDTIVSAVVYTLHTFLLFVKQTLDSLKSLLTFNLNNSPPTSHSRFRWFYLIIFDFQLVN